MKTQTIKCNNICKHKLSYKTFFDFTFHIFNSQVLKIQFSHHPNYHSDNTVEVVVSSQMTTGWLSEPLLRMASAHAKVTAQVQSHTKQNLYSF